MEDLPNDIKILEFIDDKGRKNFTELSQGLKLSRNTITKHLNRLRDDKLIQIEYEGRKIYNLITPEGKIELERYRGKKDPSHYIQVFLLVEKEIKKIRDGFLKRLGNIPNSLLIDCVENFIQFRNYNFHSRLPSEEFQYYLAYYLARFDIQNCRSINWIRLQPKKVQLSQGEFCKAFKINPIDIDYFCKEWNNIMKTLTIIDDKKNKWFLSQNSLFYETLMQEIHLRTKRGILQELIFENYNFDISQESIMIAINNIKSHNLELDFAQQAQIRSYVERMIDFFLKKRRGYKSLWQDLPTDVKKLTLFSIELEEKLNNIEKNSPRRLEVLETLFKINQRLSNYEEALIWGEKCLEIEPNNPTILTNVVLYYLHFNRYDDFVKLAKKACELMPYEVLIRLTLTGYYIDVEKNLIEALKLIDEMEQLLYDNLNLSNLYAKVLYQKSRAYLMKGDLDRAFLIAERVWYQFLDHSEDSFSLLNDIYKQQQAWERLEDFCLKIYLTDRYNPLYITSLFYAHLRRDSFIKARELYEDTIKVFPEFIPKLDAILKELNISIKDLRPKKDLALISEDDKTIQVKTSEIEKETLFESIANELNPEMLKELSSQVGEYIPAKIIEEINDEIVELIHDKLYEALGSYKISKLE